MSVGYTMTILKDTANHPPGTIYDVLTPGHAARCRSVIEVTGNKKGIVASLILGTLDTVPRDCKRVLWSSPMPTPEEAMDDLWRKIGAIDSVGRIR